MTILAIFIYSDESEHTVPFSRSPRGLQKLIIDDNGSHREHPVAVHFEGCLTREQFKSVKICNNYRTWLWHCIDQVKRRDMVDDIDEPNKQSIWDVSSGKISPKEFFNELNQMIKVKEIRKTQYKHIVTIISSSATVNHNTPLNIQWDETSQYPLPKPPPEKWRQAKMPDDWNKPARFADIYNKWVYGTLCGVYPISNSFINNHGESYKYCEVKEE